VSSSRLFEPKPNLKIIYLLPEQEVAQAKFPSTNDYAEQVTTAGIRADSSRRAVPQEQNVAAKRNPHGEDDDAPAAISHWSSYRRDFGPGAPHSSSDMSNSPSDNAALPPPPSTQGNPGVSENLSSAQAPAQRCSPRDAVPHLRDGRRLDEGRFDADAPAGWRRSPVRATFGFDAPPVLFSALTDDDTWPERRMPDVAWSRLAPGFTPGHEKERLGLRVPHPPSDILSYNSALHPPPESVMPITPEDSATSGPLIKQFGLRAVQPSAIPLSDSDPSPSPTLESILEANPGQKRAPRAGKKAAQASPRQESPRDAVLHFRDGRVLDAGQFDAEVQGGWPRPSTRRTFGFHAPPASSSALADDNAYTWPDPGVADVAKSRFALGSPPGRQKQRLGLRARHPPSAISPHESALHPPAESVMPAITEESAITKEKVMPVITEESAIPAAPEDVVTPGPHRIRSGLRARHSPSTIPLSDSDASPSPTPKSISGANPVQKRAPRTSKKARVRKKAAQASPQQEFLRDAVPHFRGGRRLDEGRFDADVQLGWRRSPVRANFGLHAPPSLSSAMADDDAHTWPDRRTSDVAKSRLAPGPRIEWSQAQQGFDDEPPLFDYPEEDTSDTILSSGIETEGPNGFALSTKSHFAGRLRGQPVAYRSRPLPASLDGAFSSPPMLKVPTQADIADEISAPGSSSEVFCALTTPQHHSDPYLDVTMDSSDVFGEDRETETVRTL
jgi:hypothetical protein